MLRVVHRILVLVVLVLVTFCWNVPTSKAQVFANSSQAPNANEPTRFAAGFSFIVSQPKEEFRRNVGNGIGIGGTLNYHLDRAGWVNLRFDPSWLRYGHESKRVPFSRTVGGRIEVDVTTTNQIVGLSFGPELTLPKGPVRPYLNAAFSGLLFWTTSSVRGIDSNDEEIARMRNHRDWTRAWVFGTGVKVPLGGRDSNFNLDFGVRYHNGSETSYLREGSIRDNPDGSITITSLTNETPFLMYSVGFNYRFPHGS